MKQVGALLLACALVSPAIAQEPPPDEPYGAEPRADESHTVHIPEPMVFDLVRGLGARKGEVEANVLAGVPVSDAGDRPVAWAPEVEWAFVDGMAIEFELPFEDGDLEAYKAAAQFTIGVGAKKKFIHGVQVIAESYDGKDRREYSALYIPAVRFGKVWSGLAMIGLRADTGRDAEHDDSLLLFNPSVYADLGLRSTVGLEVNVESEFGGDTSTRVVPQIHWEFVDAFMLQAGPAAVFHDGRTDYDVAFRIIWSK